MDGEKARSLVIDFGQDICIWLLNTFQDYAISIATIHHLSTRERRKRAIQVRVKFSDRRHSPECIAASYSEYITGAWACLGLRLGCRARRAVKKKYSK